MTYAYNGDGLRVSKDDGVVETRYVHDGNNVLLETDDVGFVEADFTVTPDVFGDVISVMRDSVSSIYQFDGIKNVRALVDIVEVVTDVYRFDAWLRLIESTGSTPNSQYGRGQNSTYRLDPDAGPGRTILAVRVKSISIGLLSRL